MKQPSRAWALAASTLLMVGFVAGCGDSAEEATTTPTPTTSAAAPPTASAPAQGATVATGASDLGTILVDGKGMTLYLFTKDTQGSGASVCEGECLVAWPPLVGKPSAGTGVDASKLGQITRSDGSIQATYNGWPLYYWYQDKKPGDTSGQDVMGVWYVLDPQGNAIGSSG